MDYINEYYKLKRERRGYVPTFILSAILLKKQIFIILKRKRRIKLGKENEIVVVSAVSTHSANLAGHYVILGMMISALW